LSTRYRCPAPSIAAPRGEIRPRASVRLDWPFAKLNCPSTTSAVVSPAAPGVPGEPPPEASGLKYSTTRLLPLSVTYRLPVTSGDAETGLHSASALGAPLLPSQLLAVKSPPCPNTRSAVVSPADPGVPGVPPPSALGLLYSSTR